jgi:hypothetical protein
MRYRKQQRGLVGKVFDKVGKQLMASSYAALGATAPASPALPSIPLIPAV